MKHLCFSKLFWFILFLSTHSQAALTDKSAILYYGDDLSYPMVGIHDYIIVQPENVATDTYGFQIYQNKIYAYISLGEVSLDKSYYKRIKAEWIIGRNRIWNSKIVDFSQKAYRDFMIQKVMKPLYQKGFRNFFLDTLDSYQIPIKEQKGQEKQVKALAEFIHEIHQQFPKSNIIINRGFEVLEEVASEIKAVLFESY